MFNITYKITLEVLNVINKLLKRVGNNTIILAWLFYNYADFLGGIIFAEISEAYMGLGKNYKCGNFDYIFFQCEVARSEKNLWRK